MSSKSFLKKKMASGEMELQITSMADIFMILLVFLLKSYSTSVSQTSPDSSIKLPLASSQEVLKDALKVEVSQNSVIVDQKKIVTLRDYRFQGAEAESSEPITKAILEERKRLKSATQTTLLLLADEKTPYATLQRVLHAISKTGFIDLQLVVVSKDS